MGGRKLTSNQMNVSNLTKETVSHKSNLLKSNDNHKFSNIPHLSLLYSEQILAQIISNSTFINSSNFYGILAPPLKKVKEDFDDIEQAKSEFQMSKLESDVRQFLVANFKHDFQRKNHDIFELLFEINNEKDLKKKCESKQLEEFNNFIDMMEISKKDSESEFKDSRETLGKQEFIEEEVILFKPNINSLNIDYSRNKISKIPSSSTRNSLNSTLMNKTSLNSQTIFNQSTVKNNFPFNKQKTLNKIHFNNTIQNKVTKSPKKNMNFSRNSMGNSNKNKQSKVINNFNQKKNPNIFKKISSTTKIKEEKVIKYTSSKKLLKIDFNEEAKKSTLGSVKQDLTNSLASTSSETSAKQKLKLFNEYENQTIVEEMDVYSSAGSCNSKVKSKGDSEEKNRATPFFNNETCDYHRNREKLLDLMIYSKPLNTVKFLDSSKNH